MHMKVGTYIYTYLQKKTTWNCCLSVSMFQQYRRLALTDLDKAVRLCYNE